MTSRVGGSAGDVVSGSRGYASGGTPGPGKTPFRHIDDLVSVSVDLDPHTPLRKLLQIGDNHMRQAITFNEFGRPDLALQEYIKAFTIAVDKVPRHKEFPTMKSDRGDLGRLYNDFKSRINVNCALFSEIKDVIKEDNRRSGVQPKSSSETAEPEPQSRSSTSSRTSTQAQVNSYAKPRNNGSDSYYDVSKASSLLDVPAGTSVGPKLKPPVQPKPQSLHGKAIKPTPKASPSDLANRFARLRDSQGPEASRGAVEQRQSGKLGELPLMHPSHSVDMSIPAMPKVPEAIYNPARGTVTSEIANLPSSTPRGMFSRTNSVALAAGISDRSSMESPIKASGGGQFVTAHTYRAPQTSTPSGVLSQAEIPVGDVITAKTLARLLDQRHSGLQLLLIDVRDRDSFNEGHIQSSGTICVEPEILMRENISADEIADSMVLAPSMERLAIEQRDKVDLVVIYDEDSASIPSRVTGNAQEMVLYNLRQALSYYSYNRPLKNSPKLLLGGLDSWIEEYGEQSLEISPTHSMRPDESSSHIKATKRRLRAKTRTLSSNEVKQFEDIIKQDEAQAPAFDYVTSTEDFIRRFPSITGTPESMSSAVKGPYNNGGVLESPEDDFLDGITPAPPRRPAPTFPRTRYSGLESRDENPGVTGYAMMADATTSPEIGQHITGLDNLGANSCYCNSTVQVLLASPGFIDDIVKPNWPAEWCPASTAGPRPPQLLGKILKNLLQWMYRRQFKSINATTLLRYMHSTHRGYRAAGKWYKLGDSNQHDVDELINFIFASLASETDKTSENPYNTPKPLPPTASNLVSMYDLWNSTQRNEHGYNFVNKHWSIFQMITQVCASCKHRTYSQDILTALYLPPKYGQKNLLVDMINNAFLPDTVEAKCSACSHVGVVRTPFLAGIPPLLRINLRRQGAANDNKDSSSIIFPLVLDLTKITWDHTERVAFSQAVHEGWDTKFSQAPVYDLYAIQVHHGATYNAGHYWSWVRGDQPDTWVRCEDSNIGSHCGADWTRSLQELHDCPDYKTPVSLYYSRRDVPNK